MWKDYQQEAAVLFRSLDFQATVEAIIEGARGVHEIDVWAVGSVHGIEVRWVVECKDWKTNIPKEKVLALLAIVQDVGADRGFLLSETGFQSGALRAASQTNVTLTSIADLRDSAHESLMNATAASIQFRLARVKRRLHQLHKQTDDYFSEFASVMGDAFTLEFALEDALQGRFPTLCASHNDTPLAANSWDEFVAIALDMLGRAEQFAAEGELRLKTIPIDVT